MKKTLALFLSLVMIFTSLSILTVSVTADEPEVLEPGTPAYEAELAAAGYRAVSSFADIADITNYDETAKYYLTADVTLSDEEAHKGYFGGVTFKGVLDGNGHTVYNAKFSLFGTLKGTIKNLTFSKYINEEEERSFTTKKSLFGSVADGAVIENITSNRTFADDISDYWGAIVREIPAGATVTFKGVTNNSSIAYPWAAYNIKIGGFIGLAQNGSTIIFENCVNNGRVQGSQAGGFIAVLCGNNTISFKNCANNGTVVGSIGKSGNGEGAYGVAGGFIGSYNNTYERLQKLNVSFEGCVNTGDVIRWEGNYERCTKEHKVAQGGLIGNLGDGSKKNVLNLSIQNCTISNCQIGAGTRWQDAVSEETGEVITDFTQGYVGAIAGWVGTATANNDQDSITIENVVVRNVAIESANPAFASLFLNTDAAALNVVVLKNCFAIACDGIRAATGNVKFSYTGEASGAVTVNKTQKSAAAEEKMALRFLGSIDSLNHRGIGFLVEAKEGENRSYYFLYNKKAYKEVNNGEGKLTRDDFGGKYITAAVLEDVSATNANKVTYTVTPFAVELDDRVLVGAKKSVNLTAGKLS